MPQTANASATSKTPAITRFTIAADDDGAIYQALLVAGLACQDCRADVGLRTGAGISGFSAAAFGYAGHFVLSSAVGVVTVLVIVRWLIVSEPVAATTPATAPGEA